MSGTAGDFGICRDPGRFCGVCRTCWGGTGAVAGLVVGALTVGLWIFTGLKEATGLYEMIPGFALSWLAIYAVSLATADRGEFRAIEGSPAE